MLRTNMAEQNGKSWTEYFRIITPFLLLVLTLAAGGINSKLADIDTKLFKHLTNDEMHCPRSMVIQKPEFDVYQSMRDRQMCDLKEDIKEIKRLLSNNKETR